MKSFLIIIFSLFALNSFSQTLEVEVISTNFETEDHLNKKSLCLTIVRLPLTNDLVGIVESIQDCFYARMGRRSQDQRLLIDLKYMAPLDHEELNDYLQKNEGQLRFYFSDGE